VLFASSADEALHHLAEHAPVDVMVTDLSMPEVDGVILLNIVRQRYPDTARVVHSAHIEAFGSEDIHDLCVSVLAKPAGVLALVGALEQACGYSSAGALVAG
jgi:DNA-binding NarL/FixJ family response regulator